MWSLFESAFPLNNMFDNSTQNHPKCRKKPIRQIGNFNGPAWGSYLVRLMESEKEKGQEDNNDEEARTEFSKYHTLRVLN